MQDQRTRHIDGSATIEPAHLSEENREILLMLCRAALMFVSWANRRYRLGLRLRD